MHATYTERASLAFEALVAQIEQNLTTVPPAPLVVKDARTGQTSATPQPVRLLLTPEQIVRIAESWATSTEETMALETMLDSRVPDAVRQAQANLQL